MFIFRFFRILWISFRYGLDEIILSSIRRPFAKLLLKAISYIRPMKKPRGLRLRLALERLGPIYVKFGQVMSTRPDLFPPDVIHELVNLQDKVPPFPGEQAVNLVEKALGAPVAQLYKTFDTEPYASASVAQVHQAYLFDGRKVAVKVLRPKILKTIEKDLALMKTFAAIVHWLIPDGRRLRPKAVVSEFDKYLHDELDLQFEAANCSQIRRNFSTPERQHLLQVPDVVWELTTSKVFTMEWVEGVRVSDIETLKEHHVDIPKLAREGVEVFFTQVFEDGVFHADMHPGNILVSVKPETLGQYIAVDFGIVGSLSEFDKNYLAQNFLAFFRRNYRRVAQLHIESGWAPKETREEELEAAVRAVCEPYFDRPLSEISLGQVLLRLFQTSRRFNIEIQPQLVLLQKTLLNVEGMGRELDPNLDLWQTAKPFLERWMWQRIGPQGFKDKVKKEAVHWAQLMPELPRLTHAALSAQIELPKLQTAVSEVKGAQNKTRRALWFMTISQLVLVVLVIYLVYKLHN